MFEAKKLPKGWQWVEIEKLINIIVPTRDKPKRFCGDIPWITLPDIDELFISNSKNLLTHEDAAEVGNRLMPPNTVLLSCAGSLGKVAVTTREVYANQQFYGLVAKPNLLDFIFLAFCLKSLGEEFFFQLAGVSTVGFFSKEKALGIRIALPPLAEQKRIAAIAQKADRLRRTRRYALKLSDTFLQSVFLEMFGDPVANSKEWTKSTIEEISTQVTDGEHTTPERSLAGIKLLSARNIQNGYIDFNTGLDYIPEYEYHRIKKRCNPEFGDVLMSCSGSIGRVTTVNITEPFSMVRSVALIKPNRAKIFSKYLEHYLRTDYSQYLINKNAHQSSQANIFTGQIKDLPILLPPLPLQEKFAQIVQKFERLRTQQREAERQAEHLFQTILHRAFRGELTSSDINEETESDLLEQTPPKQTKPETTAKAGDTSTRDAAKNPNTFAKQQYTEAIQLKLPGFE